MWHGCMTRRLRQQAQVMENKDKCVQVMILVTIVLGDIVIHSFLLGLRADPSLLKSYWIIKGLHQMSIFNLLWCGVNYIFYFLTFLLEKKKSTYQVTQVLVEELWSWNSEKLPSVKEPTSLMLAGGRWHDEACTSIIFSHCFRTRGVINFYNWHEKVHQRWSLG